LVQVYLPCSDSYIWRYHQLNKTELWKTMANQI